MKPFSLLSILFILLFFSGLASAGDEQTINSLLQQGGVIHLQHITYTISDSIVLQSDTILEGEPGTVIKLVDNARWPTWQPLIKAQGLHNVTIENLKIDANSDNQGNAPTWNGHSGNEKGINWGMGNDNIIHAIDCDSISIHDCTFCNSLGDGLRVKTSSNIQFYNNKMDGSWSNCTALYYSDGDTSNTLIYNNIFATENTTAASGSGGNYFIRIGRSYGDTGIINILNNTFSSDSLAPLGYGLNMTGAIALGTFPSGTSSTVTIENNILSGPEIDVQGTLNGAATLTMDYNLHNPNTGSGYGDLAYINGTQYKYANLVALHTAGYENNGMGSSSYARSYPGFVTVPTGAGTGNWQLRSNSPAIDKGVDFSATFTTDLLGNTRQVPWDIGAFQRKKLK